MNQLCVMLDRCFGIEHLDHEFSFENGHTISIYARNGLMKTSFAKTFQMIQQNKASEIKDVIFEQQGSAHVTIDGRSISNEDVFVIKSYENSYESDVTPLLVNGRIKELLSDVLSSRSSLMRVLEQSSGLKQKKTSLGKTVYELEEQITKDFSFENGSILLNLKELSTYHPQIYVPHIQYTTIFDSAVYKKIIDPKFQNGLENFISASDTIYNSFGYLEKGKLTIPKIKNIRKALADNSFFVRNNIIHLSGVDEIDSIDSMDEQIRTIDQQIRQLPEYKDIENLLKDTKGSALKDIIEQFPQLIEYLRTDRLNELRKLLWASYIQANREIFDDLCEKYTNLSDAIDSVQLDDSPWQKALEIFNKRFTVPFKMSIANLKGAIIGEAVPQVQFAFSKGNSVKIIDRSTLDGLDTLSQGEKRALYLLNIIFDIEKLKDAGREVVLIIDDIADSFDYKNKYAIIEYLYEISKLENFYMLILTHNFDFFRTVSDRLGINHKNRLSANYSDDSITIDQAHYSGQPFSYWKLHPTQKNVIAMIPFVRNMVEYGNDKSINTAGLTDYLFLTSLLHEKQNTLSITFNDLLPLYDHYIGIRQFDDEISLTDTVIDQLYSISESIANTDVSLESKIILAISIRHKAESIMINFIKAYTGLLCWKRQNIDATTYLSNIEEQRNQTRYLFEGYRQIGSAELIRILEEVNIMTPEHIHMNSFMYEPILDMDIGELLRLYNSLKSFEVEET